MSVVLDCLTAGMTEEQIHAQYPVTSGRSGRGGSRLCGDSRP
ncbi:MAG: hypothetical protein ABSD78_02115 [Acidimicrobiales bacterium]